MSEKATITPCGSGSRPAPSSAEEQSENGAAFRISGLSPELWPSFPSRTAPPTGDGCFLFRPQPRQELHLRQPPRLQRGPERPDRGSGFFEQLTEWVLAQNDRHHLPRLDGRKEALRVSVTSSGYIVTAESGRL